MKITQIMYTNEAAGLSCRGEERFLPYGEALCLAGRAIPTARLWKKMQDDGAAEFPDQTGRMDGTCQLMQQSFTPRKAVYELYRTEAAQQRHIATIALEQFPRPTAIGGHKVRGHIAVSHPLTPSSTAEALSLAGVLDTAGQIALGLGVIRLVYDDTPPGCATNWPRPRPITRPCRKVMMATSRPWNNPCANGKRAVPRKTSKKGPFPCPTTTRRAWKRPWKASASVWPAAAPCGMTKSARASRTG